MFCVFYVKVVNLSEATILFVAIHRHSIDSIDRIFIDILLSGKVVGCIKLLK